MLEFVERGDFVVVIVTRKRGFSTGLSAFVHRKLAITS